MLFATSYNPNDFEDIDGVLVVMVACLVTTYVWRRWGKRVVRSEKPYIDPLINFITLVPMTCFVIVASSAAPIQDIADSFVSAVSKHIDLTNGQVQVVAWVIYLISLAVVGYKYVKDEKGWALWAFGILMASAAIIVPSISEVFNWITYNLIMIPWNIFWSFVNQLVNDWYS